MSPTYYIFKRIFDLVLVIFLIPLFIVPIIFLFFLASIDTRTIGIFIQDRIGFQGNSFKILKVRTIRISGKISKFGYFLRRTKLDELPQIFNILIGDMSFVGPRPDLQGYADVLSGEDRIILNVKPGLTGPASLKYAREEEMFKLFIGSRNVLERKIWLDKVSINKEYVRNYSFMNDLKYLLKTVYL